MEALKLRDHHAAADLDRPLTFPSVEGKVSPAEWRARVDLAACYRLIDHFGMSDLIYNHISARVPDSDDAFLINLFGLTYDEITASSLVKVNLAGEVLCKPEIGYGVNPAGFVLHSAVHAARADAHCVIHTHSLAGMAVSALKEGLLPLTQTSMRFARVAIHEYEGVVLDLEERDRIVADLGTSEAMILRNHGLLTVGSSVPEAFNNMYRLERACISQLMALAAGRDAVMMPAAELIARATHQYQPGVRRRFGVMEWPAMLRKLERIDPGYRT